MSKMLRNFLTFMLFIVLVVIGTCFWRHKLYAPETPTSSSLPSPQQAVFTGTTWENASGNTFETQYYQNLHEYFEENANGYENMYAEYGRAVE